MKKNFKLGIAVVTAVCIAYLAVGCAVGPASIDDVIVAESLDAAYKPVNPVDSYPAGTTLFSISVKVLNLRPENNILVKWFYEGQEKVLSETSYSLDKGKAGSGYLGFTLETSNGFPAGTYYVEAYLDGQLIKTVEWSVK